MDIRLIDLEGTPREMGRHHGDLFADGARAMCDARIDLCLQAGGGLSRAEVLALAGESLPVFADVAPTAYAEFQGIADGVGVSEEELFIGNGYTDFVDLVRRRGDAPSECTAFQVAAEASADGRAYMGQTWDMNGTAFPHVVAFRRRPTSGPASVTMTTTGCLSLVGVNECGVAIGNTNLVPHDARNGVMYLAIIHEALAQTTFEAAVRVVTDAPRMSGHFYTLGGPDGELVGIETTGGRHVTLMPNDAGLLGHANHYTDSGLAAYVGQGEPTGDSPVREARMWELLRGADTLDAASLTRILADHTAPLCRHERPGSAVRTCSAAVICPAERSIRMVKGYPCEGEMVEVAP